MKFLLSIIVFSISSNFVFAQKQVTTKQADIFKNEVVKKINDQLKTAQVMVDKIFSFGELGFQEMETSNYVCNILEKNGFQITKGISGVPTAWWAKWGSGKPVIAIGTDLDCIPKASQKPGVAYHDPIIEGAPGHGEGHNSGMPLNILSVFAVKEIMQREKLSGTLILWPGVAEELLGTKAYYTRDGYFDSVDLCIFTHVDDNLGVTYGQPSGSGLISVQYEFEGEAAHAGFAPWRGRSAADAVELMSIGWQYQREHLDPLQRSHSIINNGGDQPNVVPSKASIWYYLRHITYPQIMNLYEKANRIADGAAMMTGTTVKRKILGSAWPRHFNKPIAEATYQNILKVGLPTWSNEDQELAKALQENVNAPVKDGLSMIMDTLERPKGSPASGGSDDIGDISWKLPTITLTYPSNIPGLQGHHWSNAVAMATPIAHKGVIAGAKVEAMTLIDMITNPDLTKQAWDYFKKEQGMEIKYVPMVGKDDKPAIYLNKEIMATYRPLMKQYYYDETKYNTYLEQLGIKYPTVKNKP
ncbi:MAG: peptidase dimerization domain-containing protein [Saprospiraceae bacterium]